MATSIVTEKLNAVLDWCAAGQGALFAAYRSDRAALWTTLQSCRENALIERALWVDGAIDAYVCYWRLDAIETQAEQLAAAANVASERAIFG